MEDKNIDYHLQQALEHLESALDQSVGIVIEHDDQKKEVGRKWEQFLGQFMGQVREKGKQSRLNLLSLVPFPRLR